MKFTLTTILVILLNISTSLSAQKTIELNESFNKIIVSPHIETIFIKGDKPNIEIKHIAVPIEKFNYELINNTLQVYLEGAKTFTKNKKVVSNKICPEFYMFSGLYIQRIII